MANPFRRSARYRRYKTLFRGCERYLLEHPDDVFFVSETATVQVIANLSLLAERYGLGTSHDPEALATRVKPEDSYLASEHCFAKATEYKRAGSERFAQGATLAGLYFGLASLVAQKEWFVGGLWRRVSDLILRAAQLAAQSNSMHPPGNKIRPQKPLHEKTREALKRTGMSEERFEAIEQLRKKQLESLRPDLRGLFEEQQRLFAEVQKASELHSPAAIFGAFVTTINLLDRVLARRQLPPAGLPESEMAVAEMKRIIHYLGGADRTLLRQVEALTRKLCDRKQDESAKLGAKATRVVALGPLLQIDLADAAPLLSHEAQWLAGTLVADLEKLALH